MFIVNQTYISLTFTTDDSLWVTEEVALTTAARTIDVVRYTIQLHIYNIVLRYTSDSVLDPAASATYDGLTGPVETVR